MRNQRPDSRTCGEQIAELRSSQVALLSRIEELESDVRDTEELALGTEAIVRGPSSINEMTVKRAILFANIAARAALRSNHPELNRSCTSLCPGNSVRQIVLRSQATDCSPSDFRILANYFVRKVNIKRKIMPSSDHVLLASNSSVSSFEVVFDTFADFCEALQIAIDHREASVYRERRTRTRALRCVQVLGVQIDADADNSQLQNIDSQEDSNFVTAGRKTCDAPTPPFLDGEKLGKRLRLPLRAFPSAV